MQESESLHQLTLMYIFLVHIFTTRHHGTWEIQLNSRLNLQALVFPVTFIVNKNVNMPQESMVPRQKLDRAVPGGGHAVRVQGRL